MTKEFKKDYPEGKLLADGRKLTTSENSRDYQISRISIQPPGEDWLATLITK